MPRIGGWSCRKPWCGPALLLERIVLAERNRLHSGANSTDRRGKPRPSLDGGDVYDRVLSSILLVLLYGHADLDLMDEWVAKGRSQPIHIK